MKFKQIEAFRTVVQTGSMTTAAEALHTSQPNISRLIAQLEDAADFSLFMRVSGRLQLTDEGAGAELFRDVERAFIGLRSLQDSADQIRRSGTGRLRVGAAPSIALTTMPEGHPALSRDASERRHFAAYERFAARGAMGRHAVLRSRRGGVCGPRCLGHRVESDQQFTGGLRARSLRIIRSGARRCSAPPTCGTRSSSRCRCSTVRA